MNKKGFTLMEILVVILIVATILSLFQVSYRKSQIIRANERARGMFIQLTNAARLFNEAYPNSKIYGSFGNSTAQTLGFYDPCYLFEEYTDNATGQYAELHDNIAPFALRFREWGIANADSCNQNVTYEGYRFVLCNPSFSGAQPSEANNLCTPDKFAVMIATSDVTSAKYTGNGVHAWITNGYSFENNYN